MNNIYLLVAVLVTAGMTVGFAYAERSTVEVPFDYTGNSCWFDTELVIYTCKWEGSSETVTKQGLTEAGIIPPEIIAKESKEAHEVAKEEKEADERTPTEKQIDRLIEKSVKGNISSADRILLDLLTDLKDSCELGIEHGKLIQKYAEFELPMSDPRTAYRAIDYGKNIQLGNIIKKIEECKAWDKYRVDVLGQRYLDIEVDDSTSQLTHRQMVTDKGTYPSDKLTDESFTSAQQQAKESICRASFYDAQYKKQMGCENAQVKEYPAIQYKPLDVNPSYKAWKTYMSTGGDVDVETLKKKEVSKAHTQSLESFALQHGIDIADLKNLVQPVEEYNNP